MERGQNGFLKTTRAQEGVKKKKDGKREKDIESH